MTTIYGDRMRIQHISPTHTNYHYEYRIYLFGPFQRNTICIVPVTLKIANHEPSTYFDVATFTTNNHHVAVITVIAINMAAPTRDQFDYAPMREHFLAGVNGTGSDGRPLPAGARAAASMTAAQQEARPFFPLGIPPSREVERENEGKKKSLLRRVGSKIASVFKRKQK